MTIERVKELIGCADLSDEEAEQIRDDCRIFAEIIFEQWLYEKRKERIENQVLIEKIFGSDVNSIGIDRK